MPFLTVKSPLSTGTQLKILVSYLCNAQHFHKNVKQNNYVEILKTLSAMQGVTALYTKVFGSRNIYKYLRNIL